MCGVYAVGDTCRFSNMRGGRISLPCDLDFVTLQSPISSPCSDIQEWGYALNMVMHMPRMEMDGLCWMSDSCQ
jgi:hypothetical protein